MRKSVGQRILEKEIVKQKFCKNFERGRLLVRRARRCNREDLEQFAFVERSGTMKAPVGLLSDRTVLRQQDGGASPRQVPVCRTAPNRGKAPAFQKRMQGLFVYFKMISPFSPASTTRVPPEARLPSIRRSAAGSSTALRMTRRKSRAPNLPPSAFFTSALRAAGV